MASLNDIAALFSSISETSSVSENGDLVSAKVALRSLETGITAESLVGFFQTEPTRDVYNLAITIGEQDAASFSSSDPADFGSQLESLYAVNEEAGSNDEIELNVKVAKKSDASGTTSIFSIQAFFKWFNKLSTQEQFRFISKRLESGLGKIRFECKDDKRNWGTATILFNDFDPNWESACNFHSSRDEVLARQTELVNFANASRIKVVPFDFWLLESSGKIEFDTVFNKLLGLSTILATADQCSFTNEGQKVDCRYRGIRVLDRKISANQDIGSPDVCIKIVQWLYSGGESSDKAGLLRNILCLKDELKFDFFVLHSARSGYELYLKENISRYIDLKNKVTDFIEDIKLRLDQRIDGLTKTLGGTVFATITFFVTVIIAQSGQGKAFEGFITDEVALLCFAFGLVSLLLMVSSNISVNFAKSRVEKSYSTLERRYSDLFSPEDLKSIISKEDDLRPLIKSCGKRQLWISLIWGLIVMLLVIPVILLWPTREAFLQNLF